MQGSFEERVLELTDRLAAEFSQERGALRVDVREVVGRIKGLLKMLLFRMRKRKMAVEGVTTEQIWAQIAEYNEEVLKSVSKPLAALLSEEVLGEREESTGEVDTSEKEEEEQEQEEEEEKEKEEKEEGEQEEKEEEEDEEESEEEGSNELQEFENSEQERMLDLQDFSEDDEPEQAEEEIDGEVRYEDMYKSKKEIRQEREQEGEIFEQARKAGYLNEEMVEEIEQIEARMVQEKDWQLKGEITAKQRPMNSLLAEHLDFAVVARNIPSSEEMKQRNDSIQSMIKRRVKETLFDDPIHKFAGLTQEDLDGKSDIKFEKAEKGLGEEYASLIQKQALGGDPIESQHIEKIHEEIDQLQSQLFSILDQMSQTSYVRIKKPRPEIKAEKIAALQIEEKVPIAVSIENRQLAGELLDPKREVGLVGREERERGAQHKQKKRVIRAKMKGKKSEEKAARRMFEGAALAKFEARLKYEQEKQRKQKEGGAEKKESKHGRLKSVQFFKSMENLAKNDIAKKREEPQRTKIIATSKKFKL